MQQLDIQRLEKIIEYCDRIARTVDRYGNSFEVFSEDEDYQQSVSFSILQIGELVAGLSAEYKDDTSGLMPWNQIKAMRNIVAHGYGSISLNTVWATVHEDIPELRKFCDGQIEDMKTDLMRETVEKYKNSPEGGEDCV